MAEPSIFHFFMARSILSTIFTTSNQLWEERIEGVLAVVERTGWGKGGRSWLVRESGEGESGRLGRSGEGESVWARGEKKSPGGAAAWRRSEEVEGLSVQKIGLGKILGFFVVCVASPLIAKLPPLSLSFGPIFIGKMLFGPQNWSLNFLSFVNFDFFIFLYFLKTSNINVDLNEEKSMILKMTREKSNAFKKPLKT